MNKGFVSCFRIWTLSFKKGWTRSIWQLWLKALLCNKCMYTIEYAKREMSQLMLRGDTFIGFLVISFLLRFPQYQSHLLNYKSYINYKMIMLTLYPFTNNTVYCQVITYFFQSTICYDYYMPLYIQGGKEERKKNPHGEVNFARYPHLKEDLEVYWLLKKKIS